MKHLKQFEMYVELQMSENKYELGMIVVHPARPKWGPGKVVRVEYDKVHVIWRDLPEQEAKKIVSSVVPLTLAPIQHDPILDNLPPLVEEDGTLKLPAERLTVKQAVEQFRAIFPQGFNDPKYLGNSDYGERTYKWAAHELFVATLGNGQLRDLIATDTAEAVVRVERCVGRVNLLYPTEAAALRDAMKDGDAARNFLSTLADLLDTDRPNEELFAPYAKAVIDLPAERGRVATWPVATIMPYLAQPNRHMFLKPTITEKAASVLAFNLNYQPTPNWLTYSSLLRMSEVYRDKLQDLVPRDMIDVQSFFWITCGGYDSIQ
ncbi:DUF3553 domain-containing protein [Planctomycetales bacterium ZRK34]|nr:DUF3553 domain-containing protein [Planctomycetales bacterium ZRK34]